MYLSIALSLNKLFGMLLGADASASKTKAQLEECLIKLSCAKERAVLVGDSKYDAEGALQAGIDFIAATYGFGFKSGSAAAAYSPVAVCRTAEEIGSIL